jgi:hypothetical protein
MLACPSETLSGCRHIITRSRQKSSDEVNIPVDHAPEKALLTGIHRVYMRMHYLRVRFYNGE